MKKPKINKMSAQKRLFNECQALWSEAVKARAGYKSEISGKTERLNSHHLAGKPNYRLRFDLDNGYCCTSSEHGWGFHNTGRAEKYKRMVKKQRGEDIFERLEQLSWEVCKTDLSLVKLYLEQELLKFKEGL